MAVKKPKIPSEDKVVDELTKIVFKNKKQSWYIYDDDGWILQMEADQSLYRLEPELQKRILNPNYLESIDGLTILEDSILLSKAKEQIVTLPDDMWYDLLPTEEDQLKFFKGEIFDLSVILQGDHTKTHICVNKSLMSQLTKKSDFNNISYTFLPTSGNIFILRKLFPSVIKEFGMYIYYTFRVI